MSGGDAMRGSATLKPAQTLLPRLRDSGSLLLPVTQAIGQSMQRGFEFRIAENRRLHDCHPKREFHITLLSGHQIGALRRATGASLDEVLQAASAVQSWHWRPTGRLWWIAEPDRQDEAAIAASIIQPAQAAFRRALADETGVRLGWPWPHITLFLCGSRAGVGVPSRAAFRRLPRRALLADNDAAPAAAQRGSPDPGGGGSRSG